MTDEQAAHYVHWIVGLAVPGHEAAAMAVVRKIEQQAARECAEMLDARVLACEAAEKELLAKGDQEYADRWSARGTEVYRMAARIRERFGLEGK